MNTHLRLNITLPKDLARRLRAKSNRSAFIAQALREKFDAEDAARREAALAEAYRQSAAEDLRIAKEWEPTLGDGL